MLIGFGRKHGEFLFLRMGSLGRFKEFENSGALHSILLDDEMLHNIICLGLKPYHLFVVDGV